MSEELENQGDKIKNWDEMNWREKAHRKRQLWNKARKYTSKLRF